MIQRSDGDTPYPREGVRGVTPIAARIMALLDVYDALTSERIYMWAFSREKACDVILTSTGRHFDPAMVEAFKEVEDKFHQLRVELQDT